MAFGCEDGSFQSRREVGSAVNIYHVVPFARMPLDRVLREERDDFGAGTIAGFGEERFLGQFFN
jgi:hypothetical protein